MIMERKRLEELEDALKNADEQIKNFRVSTKRVAADLLNQHRITAQPAKARTDGIDPSKVAENSRKKLIVSFEHRLNNLRVRLSQTDNQNKNLKSQINSLRRNRITSNKSREKIECSIREVKRLVELVLERSRSISETRKEKVGQLQDLHRQQAKDREKFSTTMKLLAKFIDRQNRDFEESMAAAAQSTTHSVSAEPLTRGLMTIEEEKMKSDLIGELDKQITHEKQAIVNTKAKIDLYRTSFDELKRASGIHDLKAVVLKYIKSEEETFSLFNYIQTQNQEADWALERHTRLEKEIRVYEEKLSNEEVQRAEAMARLQGKWRNATEATNECSFAAQEAQRMIERIAGHVQSFFFKIQCDQSLNDAAKENRIARKAKTRRPRKVHSVLPASGVTQSNILTYAELIEQRALEILSDYTRVKYQGHQHVSRILEPGCSLAVIKPNFGGVEEDNGEKGPMSLHEMRRRAADRTSKGTEVPTRRV